MPSVYVDTNCRVERVLNNLFQAGEQKKFGFNTAKTHLFTISIDFQTGFFVFKKEQV